MTGTSDRQAFVPYPVNRVVGTIVDVNDARAAVEALLRGGFDRNDVDVLHGEADLQRLDGAAHGFLAQFQRTLMRTPGSVEEYEHLQHHIEDIKAGRFVVMVLAKGRERRHRAADILNAHTASYVGFYGRWAWESLEPGGGSGDPAPGRTYEAEIDGATTRVRYESARAATVQAGVGGAPPVSSTVTMVRPAVSLLTWRDAKNTTFVQVHDHENGAAYAVVPDPDGGLRHIAGALRRVR